MEGESGEHEGPGPGDGILKRKNKVVQDSMCKSEILAAFTAKELSFPSSLSSLATWFKCRGGECVQIGSAFKLI